MKQMTFWEFYRGPYHNDHKSSANRAMHIIGTIGGLSLVIASLTVIPIYWAIAFPIVHALPGLIGHRLFERNLEIGDIRFTAQRYPNIWFIVANHLMTCEVAVELLRFAMRKLWHD